MSNSQKGENNGMYGKHHTKETIKNIIDIRINNEEIQKIYKTKEFRKKMSKVTKGEKNGMYGKNHTKKAKNAIKKKLVKRGGYKKDKNPMYGKHHTKKAKNIIKKKLVERGGYSGDKNPNCKIKSNEYDNILFLIKQDKSLVEIAKIYGVCKQTIKNILGKINYE
jgi:hypothetical protein